MVVMTEVLKSTLDAGTLTTATQSWRLSWETLGKCEGGDINSDQVGMLECGQAGLVRSVLSEHLCSA
jgi:hypothetical protein